MIYAFGPGASSTLTWGYATKMNKRVGLLNKVISPPNHRNLASKAQVKTASSPDTA